jgi:signal transduction histidine kinase
MIMDGINRFLTGVGKRLGKNFLVAAAVLFMSNLSAITDFFLHPEIPYFDNEHIIVGAVTGLFTIMFFYIISLYLKKVTRTTTEQRYLIQLLNKEKEKAAESNLIIRNQNLELKQLNADKDLFLSVLAHDLKSPVSAQMGLSGILAENIKKYDIEKIECLVKHINISAISTYDLLDHLLMWTRSKSGKLPFEPCLTRFSLVFGKVKAIVQPLASQKNVSIILSDKDNISVFADGELLNTILRNLIGNAIKFSHNNTEILVTVIKESGNITITVTDSGIGIKAGDLEKLFNISLMYSTQGTAGEKGTGLGLLLCKEFVEKHGGTITVESEPGRGSEFKFTLPDKE